jgi:hypothetical protein
MTSIPKNVVSRESDKFMLRLPAGMREKIAEIAQANGRSMNAEIVTRLEWALNLVSEPTTLPTLPVVSGDIPYSMAQDIAALAVESQVSFDQMLARIFVAGIHSDAPQVLYMPVLPGAAGKDVSATIRAAAEFLRPDATIVSEIVTRWSALVDVPAEAPAAPNVAVDPASTVGKSHRLRGSTKA